MELFSYYRSSAAYRVRILLNLKTIDYTITPVNLLTNEASQSHFAQINPQGFVPVLRLNNEQSISQTAAIFEYLEECYPKPALLAEDTVQRAQQRSLAAIIGCDIHPLNNLRVLNYIQDKITDKKEVKDAWYAHWITEGFRAIEVHMGRNKKQLYACGSQPSVVDAYLVPQVYNALRFKVKMDNFPRIIRVYEACNQLDAFVVAAPENQPDAK